MIALEHGSTTCTKPLGAQERLDSLDTYRGLTMLLLALTVPHYDWASRIAQAYPNSRVTTTLMRQFDHVDWQGIVLWDMIQPSFMFMVEVSLVYSCNARVRRGHTWWLYKRQIFLRI